MPWKRRSIPIAAIECTESGDAISAADRVCCPRYRVRSGVDLPGGLDGIVDLDAQASLRAFNLRVASNSWTAGVGEQASAGMKGGACNSPIARSDELDTAATIVLVLVPVSRHRRRREIVKGHEEANGREIVGGQILQ